MSSKTAGALLLSLFFFSVHFVNVINNAIVKRNVSVAFYFSVFKAETLSTDKDLYLHLGVIWHCSAIRLKVIKFSILVCKCFFPSLGWSVSKVFTLMNNIKKCIICINLWRTCSSNQ